ncbi:carbohydrate porin [Pseudomonas sp. dw_358]|uniref:carbohydrate porin n=1 Tax=Pseudomonas sp. dw_358 TaxID=2720083 RepID=UPI001BD694DE|nr:carbohydrate porin [Pseudomonas sp. dw_358]
MPRTQIRQPRQRQALTLLLSLCAASSWTVSAQAADAFAVDSPWMTGDWGGLRTDLLNKGVDIVMGYTGESASSLHGGYKKNDRATRYADQWNIGANLDLQKLMGWNDAAASLSITNRNGDNLNEQINDPRASFMGSTQEIQGRGSVTRLSELWISKGWFDDKLSVKVGRQAVSDEFAVEDCSFQGLAFCGSQPGNYVDSIYNGPISQWAARVRYRFTDEIYAQIGAFNINPSDLDNDNGFKLNGSGTKGTLVPVELVWAPKVNKLPGEYRVGYYHSTADATDVYHDVNGQSAGLTGDAYRTDSGRHGGWLVAKQQLTSVDGDISRGLTVTASATFQDRQTTAVDSYQKVELVYKGPFNARPADSLGFGIARIHASSEFLRNARNANEASGLSYGDAGYVPEQHTEVATELNYGIQATKWVQIMPNLQWIRDPDGVRETNNALVFGMQVTSVF